MLNEIARVFSSNGVLIPGSEAVPVRNGSGASPASAPAGSDGPKFDQESAKVDISDRGRELQKGADGKPLSDGDKKQIRELEKTDRAVKAHEAAHEAAAGGNAEGAANFQYQSGPDGKQYAVGGHVDIDASPVKGNPDATLQKALTVQRAALAPADPSGQDRAVAAKAAQMAMQAQKEIAEEKGKAGEAGAPGGEGENDTQGGEGQPYPDPTASVEAGDGSRAQRVRGYGRATATGTALSVYA